MDATVHENLEPYLATTARILAVEGKPEAADIVRQADVSTEYAGYDTWNGGTDSFTITLRIDAALFAQLASSREGVAKEIDTAFQSVIASHTTNWYAVRLAPRLEVDAGWREGDNRQINRTTRQNIFDGLLLEKADWYGDLTDVQFLGRLFDLEGMPSTDNRFKTAGQDIWQHRVNNFDWPDDWIYDDARFDLHSCADEMFLRFLCETVHPRVRQDAEAARRIVGQYNDQLKTNGWMLVEDDKIGGRPRYRAVPASMASRSAHRAKESATLLDAGHMFKAIERMERSVETDPALAIGTAKELVESCCFTILGECGVTPKKSVDMPELLKLTMAKLKLVADDIPDAAKGAASIKTVLRAFATITQCLAEIRNFYGTGHGKNGKHKGLAPRHARLAVGAAVAILDFLIETYHERVLEDPSTEPLQAAG